MADIRCAVCREPWEGSCVRDDARHGSQSIMAQWEARLLLAGAGCPACEGDSSEDEEAAAEEFARDCLFGGDLEGEHDEAALNILETPKVARPAWRRPDPVVLDRCAGCGVQVELSPDDGKTLEWAGGEAVHYRRGRVSSYGDLRTAEDLPAADDWIGDRDSIMRLVRRNGADPYKVDKVATGYEPVPGTQWTTPIYAETGPEAFNRWAEAEAKAEPVQGPEGPRYCPGCVTECAGAGCSAIIFGRSELEAGDTYAEGASFPDPRDPYRGGAICVDCLEAIPTCSKCSEVLSDDWGDDEGRCESCAPKPADDDEDDGAEDDEPAPDAPGQRLFAFAGGES